MYRPGLQSTEFPSFPNGVVVAGDAGLPNSFSGTSTKLAPRLNFAYDVSGDGKTAVRGSVGIYYGRDVMALYETYFMHRPPFTGGSATARNGVLSNPWLTSQNPTYSTVPLPFTDQRPGELPVWPSQNSGLRGISTDYGLGSSTQWNLAVEREIFRGVRLEASYQGNSSTTHPDRSSRRTCRSGRTAPPTAARATSRAGRTSSWATTAGSSPTTAAPASTSSCCSPAPVAAGLFAQLSWAYTHARRNFAGGEREPWRHPRLGQLRSTSRGTSA